MAELHMHYVCTHHEAREILARQERFWVANCGCREERGRCARSRHDLCLEFRSGDVLGGERVRELDRAGVEGIMREAAVRHLVMRPFRDDRREQTIGFCVCCDDCCGYFLHPEENICDKGAYLEHTDGARCTDCGECAEVCYFGARKMPEGKLLVDREACYGCGLCHDICPEECIEMVLR